MCLNVFQCNSFRYPVLTITSAKITLRQQLYELLVMDINTVTVAMKLLPAVWSKYFLQASVCTEED